MTTIYCGSSLADIHEVVAPLGGALIFEEHFSFYTWLHYGSCWHLLDEKIVICKTRDAIAAAPDNVKIVRVDRSVRPEDNGAIVQHEMRLKQFLALF